MWRAFDSLRAWDIGKGSRFTGSGPTMMPIRRVISSVATTDGPFVKK